MNYFEAIITRTNQLDTLANAYLAKLSFMSNNEVIQKLMCYSEKLLEEHNQDWNKLPWWAQIFADGSVPYTGKCGSLYHALGFSVASQDAHLRNLLEIAEGREQDELDFEVVADKNIVNTLIN